MHVQAYRMELQFETTVGERFSMEVGYFDTVLEIKEKIDKYQKIPVTKQTLMFDGKVLQDDLNVHVSKILQHSLIQILVAAETDSNNNNNHRNDGDEKSTLSQSTTQSSSKKIKLFVKIMLPSCNSKFLELEMEVTDTIKKLREKLLIHQEKEVIGGGTPVTLSIMKANGGDGGLELQDQCTLDECELGDGSQIDVTVVKITLPAVVKRPIMASSTANCGSKISKITVLSNCGKKIPVEVNLSDKVAVVKKELEKVNKQMNLNLKLVQDDYFFIFKGNVMDDNRPLRWHRVQPGDTIEAFNGTIKRSD